MTIESAAFKTLIRAMSSGDRPTALRLVSATPALVNERAQADIYLDEIGHYLYAGDSALHIAAAAYQQQMVRALIAVGADVGAKNRRGAQPLHYAADGSPGSHTWNPDAQAATITLLIQAGADANAVDKSRVTPLHRAVRTRSAAAVKALLEGGADPRSRNSSGSTPFDLVVRNTGRGGSGTPEAKVQREEIVRLLEEHGIGRPDSQDR